MKLWLISQDRNDGYDTYDSAVVAAETEDAARRTVPGRHPDDYDWTSTGLLLERQWGEKELKPASSYSSWTDDLQYVTCKYLGEAAEGIEAGVICDSFNAG